MDKEDVGCVCVCVFIHTMKYYSAIKNEWNNAICSNMDGSKDFHTKWSKSERKMQIPYGITDMWNLKYDTNELIYETETDSWTQRIDLYLPRLGAGGNELGFGG